MKAFLSNLVLAALAFSAVVSAQQGADPKAPTELLQLRDLYDERIEEQLEPLRKSLLVKLDELEKKLAEARKLEEALYVRERRTELTLDAGAVFPADAREKSEDFAKLAEIYEKHRETRVRPLRATYLGALRKMESKLIRERKLEAAVVVKKEIEATKAKAAQSLRPPIGEKPRPASLAGHLENSRWRYEVHATGRPIETRIIVFMPDRKAQFVQQGVELTWDVKEKSRTVILRSPAWGDHFTTLKFDEDFESFEGENDTRSARIKGSPTRRARP